MTDQTKPFVNGRKAKPNVVQPASDDNSRGIDRAIPDQIADGEAPRPQEQSRYTPQPHQARQVQELRSASSFPHNPCEQDGSANPLGPVTDNYSQNPPPAVRLLGFQDRVAAAHHALFHDDPTDIDERRARFAEEVNETLQALGMSRDDMHRLVDYSWDRPVGEPAKEIGAALLTLTSLCVIAGYDLMACGEADLEKLQRPETIARIRAKRSTRQGRGPLPGFDPAALKLEGSADA